jgi:hypothetical protein
VFIGLGDREIRGGTKVIGRAPNAIELHPIVDLACLKGTRKGAATAAT